MSTSDLYLLNGKSTRHLAEFRNGWGSGPIAWDHLAALHIPDRPVYSLTEGHLRKVWALAGDGDVPLYRRIVLQMTFDRAYVPLANLAEAADACERFGRECDDGRRANHWPAIAQALRQAASLKHGRHTRGVALSCTSISDPWIDATPDQLAKAWPIFEAEA